MNGKELDQLLRGPMRFAYPGAKLDESEYAHAFEYIFSLLEAETKKAFRAGYEMAGCQVHEFYRGIWSSLQTPPDDKKELMQYDSEQAYLFWKKGK